MYNLELFFADLEQARKSFHWYEDGFECIRGEADQDTFCPITAVCFWKTNVYYEDYQVVDAGRAIGLDIDDIATIIKAADKGWGYDTQIRTKLMCVFNT